jgi:transposase
VSISQEDLFKIALNLEHPWYITLIDFSAEAKQLDIHVDFESGNKFPCAKCGKSSCSVHDTIERTWRHFNFFQFKTYIHCRVPRTECEDCGVKQVKVPWARKGSGFTLLVDSLIVLMAQHITLTAIAEMIDEHSCFQYLITSNTHYHRLHHHHHHHSYCVILRLKFCPLGLNCDRSTQGKRSSPTWAKNYLIRG